MASRDRSGRRRVIAAPGLIAAALALGAWNAAIAADGAAPAPANPPAATEAKTPDAPAPNAKPANDPAATDQPAATDKPAATASAPAPVKAPAAPVKSPAAPAVAPATPATGKTPAPVSETTKAPARTPARTAAPAVGKTGTAPQVATTPAKPAPARTPAVAGGVARVTPPSGTARPAVVQASAALDDHVTYQYNALGRRDPFQSLVTGEFVGSDVGGDAPVDVGGIKVVGIMWGAEDRFALVEDARGNSHVLRAGDKVMNGVVETLQREAVVVKITVDGQTQSVAIPLTRKGDQNNASR